MARIGRLCIALSLLLASFTLLPQPSAACYGCSVGENRQCDEQCVASGAAGGACAPCSRSCLCVGS
jgi:hypothetical protein